MEFDTYAAFRCWCTAPAAGTANDLLTGRRSAWQRLPACDEGRYPGVRRTHTEGRGAAGGGVMVARTMVGCALTRNQSATSNAIRSMLTTTSPRCRRPNTARSPSGLRSVPLRRRRSGSGFQTADRDDHSIGSIHWIVLDWIGLGGVTVAPVFN